VSYKRSRSPNSDTVTRAKYSKESEYWLNQPTTYSRFAALQVEENEVQLKSGHSSMPKPPPIYVTGIQYISPMIQLLEQIANEQY
jgi:hypothetical protein